MKISETTPLWLAARTLLYGKGDDFFRLKEKVLDTLEPEDIHDLRVASRRLREGLELFSPCYSSKRIYPLLRKVKQVTRHLGEMRNTDEALLFFSALKDELGDSCRDELEGLTRLFQKSRVKGLEGFKTGLKRSVPPSFRDSYLRVIDVPRLFSAPVSGIDLLAPVSSFAKDAMASRLAVLMELVPEASRPEAAEAQHLLRIAVKHFRYRLELLTFLFGDTNREIQEKVKGYQDVLGKMHDLDVFAGIVRDAGFIAVTEQLVLSKIAANRNLLYNDFSGMLATMSVEEIGAQIRSTW